MIGPLRHRVTLQQESATPDGGGGYTAGWNDVATVWARVEPLKGEETLRALQLEHRITHRVTMRYRSGVTAKMRLLHRARVLNIRAVTDVDERNHRLELLCEEGVAV